MYHINDCRKAFETNDETYSNREWEILQRQKQPHSLASAPKGAALTMQSARNKKPMHARDGMSLTLLSGHPLHGTSARGQHVLIPHSNPSPRSENGSAVSKCRERSHAHKFKAPERRLPITIPHAREGMRLIVAILNCQPLIWQAMGSRREVTTC